MQKLSRREFLRAAAAGMGAVAIQQLTGACKWLSLPPALPTPTGTVVEPLPSATTQPTETLAPPETSPEVPQSSPLPSPTARIPDLVVARHGEPETMVRRALTALGGMERFVTQGSWVIIKPNICVAYHTYEYAATTNPWVVGALVRLALEAGARLVQVMDFPFGGSPEEAYTRSGIAEQVHAAGGEMVVMKKFQFVSKKIEAGKSLRETSIYDGALDADVLINVPIAKHHSLARLTLGMKNLMGLIRDRGEIHQDLGQRLADLSSRIRPQLTVVDAVRTLMDHGPTGGSLDDVKQMDTLIASADVVAADSYAATLFGMQPHDLAYVRAGTEMGLGRSDLENLNIDEIAIEG